MRPLGARRLKVAALAICDQFATMTDNHEAGAERTRLGRQAHRPGPSSHKEIVMTTEEIARICHDVNRAWCEFNGDTSQPTWGDAPEWQRSSAINGVAFHIANPDAGDSASHDSWMAEKVAGGWVYGPVKDPSATPPTHHCIVPFDQLPADQQFKDRLFRTIVHARG